MRSNGLPGRQRNLSGRLDMAKIVGMGEILMRLSPEYGKRFTNTAGMHVFYGGAEANAVTACADYGDEVSFITALPAHDIGQAAVNTLRSHGVDTSCIVRAGERIGIYFCDSGNGVRNTNVIYDRRGSSMAEADPQAFDYERAFSGADWFHWSGITPAISDRAAEAIRQACIAAGKNGLKISCDLNYRGKLWSPEKAKAVMIPLMEYVDVCITNEADAVNCLGVETAGRSTEEILKEMKETFGFETVVSAEIDNISASHNTWKGVLYDGNLYEAEELVLLPILDRIGAGDALSGGLIHAMLKWPDDPQKVIGFASAAGALKSTVAGDLNQISEEEVLNLASAGTGGIGR